ncbi:MAG: adenylosuccinate synthase [Candidatus Curtissbacteria bacterium]|nr:adenylosuccinate synthase [Candidatus Curtissbacteria bacterium]
MKKSLKNWQGVTAIIGVDWGDSGKGRIIDDLAQNADVAARFNGGANTGHTIENNFGKFALHIVPSGIFNKKTICLVGRGVACDLESLIDDEFKQLKKAGVSWRNLIIDPSATLTMPWHKLKDGLRENTRRQKIGTTGRGVGPAYADRVERVGLQVGDLYKNDFSKLLKEEIDFQNKYFALELSYQKILTQFQNYAKVTKPLIGRTIPIMQKAIQKGQNILFEGAQGWLLDVDAGTYPFVTSSNTGIIGIWKSFDLHPKKINNIIGITKAYTTRVGAGPIPTKIEGRERQLIIEKGHEIGTTSGRTRDPGWLDLVLLKAAAEVNGVNQLALTKLDIFSGFKKIKICVGYTIGDKKVDYLSGNADFLSKCKPVYMELDGWKKDISKIRKFTLLPKAAQNYIRTIEKITNVPITFIGVGPKREEVIYV